MYFSNCAECGYEWESDEKPEECLGCGSKDIDVKIEKGED